MTRSLFVSTFVALVACNSGSTPPPMTTGPTSSVSTAPPKPTACMSSNEKDCTTKCDAGDLESCVRLAEVLRFDTSSTVKKDEARANELLRRACDKHVGKACYWLATGNAAGRDASIAKAKPLVLADCEAGDAASCGIAADLAELANDDAKHKEFETRADDLYRKSFEAGDWEACGMYAGVFYGKKDWAGALSVVTKGCDHDEPECCKWLAGQIAEGDGVAKDPARAKELFKKACRLGSATACSVAAK